MLVRITNKGSNPYLLPHVGKHEFPLLERGASFELEADLAQALTEHPEVVRLARLGFFDFSAVNPPAPLAQEPAAPPAVPAKTPEAGANAADFMATKPPEGAPVAS